MKGNVFDFVKLIVFNFALSLVDRREASPLSARPHPSKNAVLPWHKVGFLMGVLVVVNLQAFFAGQVNYLRGASDRIDMVLR